MSLPLPVIYDEIQALCRKHGRLNGFELQRNANAPRTDLFIYLLKLRNADTDLTCMNGLSCARMLAESYRTARLSRVAASVSDQILVLTNLKKKLES